MRSGLRLNWAFMFADKIFKRRLLLLVVLFQFIVGIKENQGKQTSSKLHCFVVAWGIIVLVGGKMEE